MLQPTHLITLAHNITEKKINCRERERLVPFLASFSIIFLLPSCNDSQWQKFSNNNRHAAATSAAGNYKAYLMSFV